MTQSLRCEIPWWVAQAVKDTRQEQTTWITGGLGSGKTYGAALWHLRRCLDNSKSRYSWALVPTHSKADLIYIPAFQEAAFNHFGWTEGKDYHVHGSVPRRITLKATRQEIIFHSANKYRALVGENISHWSATECGYYEHDEWFEKVQSRLRCPKANILQGIGEGTPEGMENPYERLANFEGYDEARQFKRIKLWTTDNTHLRAGYEAQLKRSLLHDPGKLRSYLYGEFVPFTKSTAYWNFVHSKHASRHYKPTPFLPLIFGWDFDVSPIAWTVMQRMPVETLGGHRYFRYTVIAESSGKSRGLVEAVAEFILQFPPSTWRNVEINLYGDPSGYAGHYQSPSCGYNQILSLLRSKYERVSLQADTSAPTRQARLEKHNALMAYDQFAVDIECVNTIRSFATSQLKPGTWDFIKPKDGKDPTHWADSCGYPVFQLTKFEDLEIPLSPRVAGVNKAF